MIDEQFVAHPWLSVCAAFAALDPKLLPRMRELQAIDGDFLAREWTAPDPSATGLK
jgi:hypothetical protein